MPNHVMNLLKLEGDTEKIDEMLKAVQKDEGGFGTVDFNKIIPMPESLNIECGSQQRRGLAAYTDYVARNRENEQHYRKRHPGIDDEAWALGKQSYENIEKYGSPTWYEWANQNWGTKWNAYEEGAIECDDISRALSFQSAWSPPLPVIQRLSEMLPEAKVSLLWADEDIGHNCGTLTMQGGEIKNAYVPEWSKASVELAASVWGDVPESFCLYLNEAGTEYEFRDGDEDILDDFSPDTFDPHAPSEDESDLKM